MKFEDIPNISRLPVEIFLCRHCNVSVMTSQSDLIAALLCALCFEELEVLWDSNKGNHSDARYESRFVVYEHGSRRRWRVIRCSSCHQTYELVPKDTEDIPIDTQRAQYDRAAARLARRGKKPSAPFTPCVFTYSHAPKGWTNGIFCEPCFMRLFDDHCEKFLEENVVESIRLANQSRDARREELRAQGAAAAFPLIGAGLLALFAFVFVTKSSGCSGTSQESEEIYYRR